MEILEGTSTSCKNYMFNEYDLAQHDLEIRVDERKKVVDNMLEFIEDRNERAEKGFDNTRFVKQEELKVIKQKLTELKGE